MTLLKKKLQKYSNKVHLNIGEVYFTKKPTVIWTVLGSCISIILFSRKHKIGAICHAQLTKTALPDTKCYTSCPVKCEATVAENNQFKFVSCAIENMLNRFKKEGIDIKEIESKIFGGANVVPFKMPFHPIGHTNIKTAIKKINEYKIKIVSIDVGGVTGRTLYLFSDTGSVFIKNHRTMQSKDKFKLMLNI